MRSGKPKWMCNLWTSRPRLDCFPSVQIFAWSPYISCTILPPHMIHTQDGFANSLGCPSSPSDAQGTNKLGQKIQSRFISFVNGTTEICAPGPWHTFRNVISAPCQYVHTQMLTEHTTHFLFSNNEPKISNQLTPSSSRSCIYSKQGTFPLFRAFLFCCMCLA